MGMFLVEAGTTCKLVTFTLAQPHYEDYVLPKTVVFEKHELRIDPTGISKHACGPHGVTIGSHLAKVGWFGFNYNFEVDLGPNCGNAKITLKDELLLVPGDQVQYG